ncbi:MAG TPA: hypothetical protein IAC83_03235, partial [Euryarchaeota archaeon]|nr:hypothetical protein [Euryarchaeota archaeon]
VHDGDVTLVLGSLLHGISTVRPAYKLDRGVTEKGPLPPDVWLCSGRAENPLDGSVSSTSPATDVGDHP